MKRRHRIHRRLKLWPLQHSFGLFCERPSRVEVANRIADRVLRQIIRAELRESGLLP